MDAKGDGRGAYNLGKIYYDGIYVPKSDSEALRWYLRAVDLGNTPYLYEDIAMIYAKGGIGVDKSPLEAEKWFIKSAESNGSLFEYILGMHYKNGEGIRQSNLEAKKWLQRAIDHGFIAAKDDLKSLD
jgi:TPR repeat protein